MSNAGERPLSSVEGLRLLRTGRHHADVRLDGRLARHQHLEADLAARGDRDDLDRHALAEFPFFSGRQVAEDGLGIAAQPERLAVAALEDAVIGDAGDDPRAAARDLDRAERSSLVEFPLERRFLAGCVEREQLGVFDLVDGERAGPA